jgi:histidinol-phosphate/aromatic aminotransferase/cobyric acid decarboxylase-like protein
MVMRTFSKIHGLAGLRCGYLIGPEVRVDQVRRAKDVLVYNVNRVGPALSQVRVPVHSDDTPESLEPRVQIAERTLMIHTLMALSSRREAAGY